MPSSAPPVHVPLEPDGVTWSLWRSVRETRANVLRAVPSATTRRKIVSGKTGGQRWHMITDPEAIRIVLRDRLDDYPKSVVTKNLLRPAIGDSLFIAEGADWRWQRRTAAPAFARRNITALAPIMSAAAENTAQRVQGAGKRAVNMLDEMVTATFDVIADVTFSGNEAVDRDKVHAAINDYIAEAGKVTVLDMLQAPAWIPRPGRMRASRTMAQTREMADAAIRARAAQGAGTVPDLLDLLRAGTDPEDGRQMSDAELRDNLLTFIVAGHETTALTLAWAMYLCAFDTKVQDRARTEVQKVLGTRRVATGEDVPNLTFVRQIIDEALRLYPPGALVSRTAQARDRLVGTEIHPGDTVILPIYALHRHADLWEEPDAFRPDRFETKPERYAYLPFGDGPRICIGASFAVQEAVIILATLLANHSYTAVRGRDPKPVMILTLRPEGGVWLQAEAV
ncbi:MAG: cytochrome P450 [Pseudomonadota bacterium]